LQEDIKGYITDILIPRLDDYAQSKKT